MILQQYRFFFPFFAILSKQYLSVFCFCFPLFLVIYLLLGHVDSKVVFVIYIYIFYIYTHTHIIGGPSCIYIKLNYTFNYIYVCICQFFLRTLKFSIPFKTWPLQKNLLKMTMWNCGGMWPSIISLKRILISYLLKYMFSLKITQPHI